MSVTLEKAWPLADMSGVAICPYGHSTHCKNIEIMESAHPVPDRNSVLAAEKAMAIASSVGANDLFLVLLSGGGSSLMCAPADSFSLEDKRQLTQKMLRSGAPIGDINLVRSFLSKIKSGGLLANVVSGAKVLTLAISDVVGDDPTKIASGPTVYQPMDIEAVRSTLRKYGAAVHIPVMPEKSKPLVASEYHIIANANRMLFKARELLAKEGFSVQNLGTAEEGEAQKVAAKHRQLILQEVSLRPKEKIAFLSGGELTVIVDGTGSGGPNQEYLLTLMSLLEPGAFSGFAVDTDGCDGIGGAAGAFFDVPSHCEAHSKKMYADYLDENDSYSFFKNLGCMLDAVDTETNVNDLRVLLHMPSNIS